MTIATDKERAEEDEPRRSRSRSRSLSRRRRKRRHSRSRSRSRDSRRSVKDSRSKSRSRSRSHSHSRNRKRKKKHKKRKKKHRKRRSYSRSRSRSGSRSRSRKKRSYSRSRSKRRSRSESVKSVNSEEGLTPEQLEEKRELERLTRDARTVFVSQLQVKVTERDVKKFFQRVCKVKDVVLIKDRFTNRSKGYGYVELRTLEDVPLGLQLSGQKFIFPNGKEGFPVAVKASEAEKNFTHYMEKKTNTATATYSGSHNVQRQKAQMRSHPVLREPWEDKIEIKNLHPDITPELVKELCEPFGDVEDLDLVMDFQGRSTGQCFVQFVHRSDAREAVRRLDGEKLLGHRLKVYRMQKGQVSKLKGTSQRDVDKLCGIESDAPGATGGAFSTNTWKLEADDSNVGQYGGGGVAMNSSQKMSLMSKLAGGAGNELLMQTKARIATNNGTGDGVGRQVENPSQQGPGRITGAASRCLLVKNLFDPREETEANWDKIIEEETASEAKRFGSVLHVFVDKESMGHVYICMHNVQSGVDCATALHGRWFAKRLVTVEYIKQDAYVTRFPEVQRLL